jgi:N-acetylmuramic acid 6-phosphate etherase
MSGTETVDPRYVDIDSWPTGAAVEAMLDGQVRAVAVLKSQVAAISAASDAAAAHLQHGGRLVYVGAGTSGRVAVQDGVELGPTYGWPRDRLCFMLAGGMPALAASVEGAEDDAAAALSQLADHDVSARDVVIGVAASGRTPFTVAAVKSARAAGALTIGIANNQPSALLEAAQLPVFADTGAEVIAGSTRMQAGTAQKAVLNLISTAIMLRLGRVYHGQMVDMIVSNEKLRQRAEAMVTRLAGCSERAAAHALDGARNDIKLAVLMALGQPKTAARQLLDTHRGILRAALEASRR